MSRFSAQDLLRPRWNPRYKTRAVWAWLIVAVVSALFACGLLAGGAISAAHSGWYLLGGLGSALLAGLCLGATLVIQFAAVVGYLLRRFALGIFLAGVLGAVALAAAPAWLFDLVDHIGAAQGADARQTKTAFGGELTVAEIRGYVYGGTAEAAHAAGGVRDVPALLLWPLQFRLVRDLVALLGVVLFVCLSAMFLIWWERKVAARLQSRLGPMRVGGWHGWAQSLADGLKIIQKEDIRLAGADRPLFKLAPYLAFVPTTALFVVLPFSSTWVVRDLDVGFLFILAMFWIGVVGVLLAGWSSNNKWSMYGGMRVACQMISSEIPLGLSLLVPVMTAGTLRLTELGQRQSGGLPTWLAFANPFTLAAAVTFFIATLAICKRSPFDLPEAESELVAGYHTEYSGYRFTLFFFAEYTEMVAAGALAAILFFGAWHSPLPAAWGQGLAGEAWRQRALYGLLFSGPIWLILKVFAFVFVQIWLRWTLPRIRLDQMMYVCVQVLLPLAVAVLVGNTFWELLVRKGSGPAVAANILCMAAAALLALDFVRIAVRGWRHRRSVVGTQAVEPLPGA